MSTPATEPVLIAGRWRPADAIDTYRAFDPTLAAPRDAVWPVSSQADLDEALDAAVAAHGELARRPVEDLGRFLDRYAERLEARGE
jgi:acyl-CoA reductase-like NAD-dependent aldehyde dehydrogenase